MVLGSLFAISPATLRRRTCLTGLGLDIVHAGLNRGSGHGILQDANGRLIVNLGRDHAILHSFKDHAGLHLRSDLTPPEREMAQPTSTTRKTAQFTTYTAITRRLPVADVNQGSPGYAVTVIVCSPKSPHPIPLFTVTENSPRSDVVVTAFLF
jgi:hypothetical protein